MLMMPETPIFLYKQKKLDEADKVLRKLYKEEYIEMKKEELEKEV